MRYPFQFAIYEGWPLILMINVRVFDSALVKEVLAREEADAQAKALEDKARQDKAQKLREQQMVSQAHICK